MARFSTLTITVALMLGLASSVGAQTPAANPDELAAALKNLLLTSMPAVLYEKDYGWGRQDDFPAIRKFRLVKVRRNDGHWRKIRVSPRDLPGGLEVRVSDLRRLDKERTSFKTFVALMTTVDFRQQVWENGIRLYSGSTRARLRVVMNLEVENLLKLEDNGSLVPDLVFRLKVTGANVSYDRLVVEHTAGIGGTGARLLGEAFHDIVKQVKPSLERNLLEKASQTILKSGDTREVRLSLGLKQPQ